AAHSCCVIIRETITGELPKMPRNIEWEIPAEIQPKPEDCAFDLDRALGAVLGLHATVPEDAFTAGTLGTERAGSGVLIRKDGLVLTIGYLITDAESLWLTSSVGGAVPGHVLAARSAFQRPRAGPRRQHDRSDRSAAADPRRFADLWPAEPAAAAVARSLRHRSRRFDRRRRAVGTRPRREDRVASRRPPAGGA